MGPCPEGMEGFSKQGKNAKHYETSMGPCPEGMEGVIELKRRNWSDKLQWGHARRAWRADRWRDGERHIELLQWGHARRAWRAAIVVTGEGADLPLQWGHARRAWRARRVGVVLRQFRALQWGHARRAWRACCRGSENVSIPDFNGAMPGGHGGRRTRSTSSI